MPEVLRDDQGRTAEDVTATVGLFTRVLQFRLRAMGRRRGAQVSLLAAGVQRATAVSIALHRGLDDDAVVEAADRHAFCRRCGCSWRTCSASGARSTRRASFSRTASRRRAATVVKRLLAATSQVLTPPIGSIRYSQCPPHLSTRASARSCTPRR